MKDSGTPGPGSYKQPESFRKQAQRQQRPLEDNNTNGPPVTWVRVTSAPSIPTRGQSYGYEEGKFGELVMQKAPKGGHSGRPGDIVGPGAYQNLNAKKSSKIATDWARSGSQRTDFTKSGTRGQIPGPGAYNLSVKEENEFFSGEFEPRGTSSFLSRSVRNKNMKKARAPGPGDYKPPDQFYRRSVPESLQFFGSTSRRFRDRPKVKNAAPGPGSYDLTKASKGRNPLADAYQLPTAATVGFASTSSRFSASADKNSQFTPAPGEYQQSSMVNELDKKLVSRTGVFGSTTKRFAHGMTSSDNGKSPGPGSYTISKSLGEHASYSIIDESHGSIAGRNRAKRGQQSSSFASTSKRGQALKPGEVPPPGTYDVRSNWSTDALKKGGKKGILGSGSQRFKQKSSNNGGLGPGAYYKPQDFVKNVENTTNVMVSSEKRFKKKKSNNVPGPGSYDTEFLYGNMNKRTFNMSIAEQEFLS